MKISALGVNTVFDEQDMTIKSDIYEIFLKPMFEKNFVKITERVDYWAIRIIDVLVWKT